MDEDTFSEKGRNQNATWARAPSGDLRSKSPRIRGITVRVCGRALLACMRSQSKVGRLGRRCIVRVAYLLARSRSCVKLPRLSDSLRVMLNEIEDKERDVVWYEASIMLDANFLRNAERCMRQLARLKGMREEKGQDGEFVRFWRRLCAITAPRVLTAHGYQVPLTAIEDVWSTVEKVAQAVEGCGYRAFANSGTLLGIVRGDVLVAHDDDVDLAVVLKSRSDEEAAGEWRELQHVLEAALPPRFAVRREGGVHYQVVDGDVRVDLFPCWFVEGRANVYPYTRGRLPEDVIVPMKEIRIEGKKVFIPRKPELVLEENYGAGWRTPDPSFIFDWATAKKEFAFFCRCVYRGGKERMDRGWKYEDGHYVRDV